MRRRVSGTLGALQNGGSSFLTSFFCVLPFVRKNVLWFLHCDGGEVGGDAIVGNGRVVFTLSVLTLPTPALTNAPGVVIRTRASAAVHRRVS